MPGVSILLRTFGAIVIVAAFFFGTLAILAALDTPPDVVTFADVVNAITTGKPVVIQFDDNPAEDRDRNGRIACGPDAANGYLGVFIAGQQYRLTYDAAARSWTTSGPYQNIPSCARYTDTYGPAKLGAIKARPEDGDLILWGAAMTFDANLDVLNAAKRKVGRISIAR